MKKIDHSTATEDLEFTEGNPATATPATRVTAQWLNVLQEEIVNVVEEASIVLDQTGVTRDQLVTAILALIAANVASDATKTSKGIIEIATGAEALGGSDDERAVTSAGLASSKSLAASGYFTLPGGLIIQWGKTTSGFSKTVTFPLAFPNNVWSVTALTDDTGISHASTCNVTTISTTGATFNQYRVDSYATDIHPVFWMAIGN